MGYKETLERMHSGKVFYFEGEELMAQQAACLDTLYDFNHTRPSEGEKRAELMKKVLAEAGEGCYIEPPLHANWGIHTHFGDHVYANFGLTLVDDTDIYVGSYVMMGPNVVLATAGHRSARSCGGSRPSSISPSISGKTSGWEPGSSSFPASPLVKIPSSEPEAS